MDANQYLSERLDPQIASYDRRGLLQKRTYHLLRYIQLFCAGAIPFVTGVVGVTAALHYAAGALGLVVSLAAAVDNLLKPQQLWTEFRTTAEALRSQRFLFLTATAPYDGPPATALGLLVRSVEEIIARETQAWAQINHEQEKPAAGRPAAPAPQPAPLPARGTAPVAPAARPVPPAASRLPPAPAAVTAPAPVGPPGAERPGTRPQAT